MTPSHDPELAVCVFISPQAGVALHRLRKLQSASHLLYLDLRHKH